MFAAALAAALAAFWRSLASVAFSTLVTAAQKSGVLNPIEATIVRKEHDFVSAVTTLKAYNQFPTGVNGQS